MRSESLSEVAAELLRLPPFALEQPGHASTSLTRIASWGLRLESTGKHPDAAASRIGGLPALPPGLGWPDADRLRSVFVAQICLADLPPEPLGFVTRFEATAALSFFVFQDSVTLEVVGGRVLALPTGAELEYREPRTPSQVVLEHERALVLRPELTLPAWGPETKQQLGLRDRDRVTYLELLSRLEHVQGIESPRHRFLGHPDRVPDDVLMEAALMEAWAEQREDYSPESLTRRAESWRALLQLDCDKAAGIAWPGRTTAYFCITDDDLLRGRYELVQAFTNSPRSS